MFSYVCVDIDECIGFHGCSYMCQNLNGTYRCLCDTGYIIQADERQCQGMYVYRTITGD